MLLKEQISAAQKAAMRAKNKLELATLRMLLSELRNREIAQQAELSDDNIIQVITTLIKQRRDAAAQFTAAERIDLAEKECAEVHVLQRFLPEPLEEHEITALIERAVEETEAQTMAQMGKVMNYLKPHVQGRADIAHVSTLVKERLN